MTKQDESFFCQYCNTCIGHGLIIEALSHRYEPICIPCRYDIINAIVCEYDLIIDKENNEMECSKGYSQKQLEQYKIIILQMRIIKCLDEAIANWQDKG